ncbi:MAG: class I SAM-dependent methyltransferase [Gammaproteobacteria bacterium]|nr:MAG: class I SAM-dependent methyltransferase [Gammaproteobacteria bacterium]
MCLNCQITQFDQSRADAFADRLVGMLNEGALCVMLSIGHRTGLFDAMLGQAPMSSGEVAHRAGLNERYVREWLNGLVVGEIVEYDAASRTYWLPGEHANWLTRESEDGNIAVFMQYIPMMGTVEDELVTCFEQGGGVPYEKYDRFHEVMAEDSGQTVLSSLQQHILPLVPGLPGRLEQGIDVLDVGCGRGRAMNLLAKLYPNSRFTGIDLSAEAIEYATAEAARMGLDNVEFIARDVSELDSEAGAAQFDWITTFDAVHDQARPANVLKGICRALKDDGYYLMQDIHASSEVQNNMDHPIGPLLYTLSTTHCMTVSLAQDGEGLGTMWGREKAGQMLAEAGFSQVAIHRLDHDFQNDYYVIRK